MKNIFIIACFCLLAYNTIAQTKYVDSLKELFTHAAKPIERFSLLNKIIDYNDGRHGNFQDTAIGLQMHRIAQQLQNDSLLAISTNVVGNYFRGKGDLPVALDYFFKAIPLAEKAKDKRRISSLYFDIAECYYNMQNFEECYRYTNIGAENMPDKNSPMYDFMATQFHRTMGNYYLKKNMPDSALKHVHELEEENTRLKKPNYILYGFLQNGTAYAQLGENDLAEVYFKKAKALADSIATPLVILIFNYGYIPYLLNTDQVEKTKQQSFQLLNMGKRINNNIAKLSAAGFLSQAYNKLQQSDSAFFYLSMESSLKDSVFSQNNFNKIQSLAFNEQIRKIDEEAKQKHSEEQRHQNIQFALIAFGIITFIIIFLLLSRSFITNTKLIEFLGVIALLIVFEFLNLLLHPFLERVTNHSPVLMLMALVCIAALLVPLHHRLEKWATARLVEKNKKIRLASAKKTIEQLEKKTEDL
jgi:tetratricopeptide (TPR) repeat protein